MVFQSSLKLEFMKREKLKIFSNPTNNDGIWIKSIVTGQNINSLPRANKWVSEGLFKMEKKSTEKHSFSCGEKIGSFLLRLFWHRSSIHKYIQTKAAQFSWREEKVSTKSEILY